MRVVGGIAGGIPLMVPKTDLRPTMEVVKNAIFNSLIEVVPDARVLDLFAGCGSLGIEALSRGAKSAVFVESDRRSAQTIEKNLAKTRLEGGEVAAMDVFKWLSRQPPSTTYHLILADPPYVKRDGDRDFVGEIVANEELRRILAPGGLFVLEHLPEEKLALEKRWDCIRQKRYGATTVSFLQSVISR